MNRRGKRIHSTQTEQEQATLQEQFYCRQLQASDNQQSGIELGSTRLRQLAWSYPTKLNIVFITVFNIGLNIELNIGLNIWFNIGLNIGFNIWLHIWFNIWFDIGVQ